MSRRSYTTIRLLLKSAGKDIFPPYDSLLRFRKERRPSIQKLDDPHIGIKFDYVESLKLATSQLVKSLNINAMQNLSEIHINVHDGLDGSGGHSIFNQRGATETNNIIMYMFCIENIKKPDGDILWTNPVHASSSSCRPVMLLMGKETYENCEIVAKVQRERAKVDFILNDFGHQLKDLTDTKMSMVDGKLHTLLTGTGGAFCCLCCASEEQCNDKNYFCAGFTIDRTIEQTQEICEKGLHLEENRKKEIMK